MPDHVICWRRIDKPGYDSAALVRLAAEWHLSGTAVFTHDREPCRLDYLVACDERWRTCWTRVTGWIGRRVVQVEVVVDTEGRWRLNDAESAAVAGASDIDFEFSPSTNLLPIRRLGLGVGATAPVRAAWLRFPALTLEPLEQLYTRTGASAYRYESHGGRFVGELEVNADGFVTRYADFWEAESTA